MPFKHWVVKERYFCLVNLYVTDFELVQRVWHYESWGCRVCHLKVATEHLPSPMDLLCWTPTGVIDAIRVLSVILLSWITWIEFFWWIELMKNTKCINWDSQKIWRYEMIWAYWLMFFCAFWTDPHLVECFCPTKQREFQLLQFKTTGVGWFIPSWGCQHFSKMIFT